MEIIASIAAIIFFLVSSYFLGNYFLNSFEDELRDRLVASIFGIMVWFGIAVIAGICYLIYLGVLEIM